MPFDGIVTKAVTEELQDTITQGKINKIYQPTATELVFTIRAKGANHTLLISIHPSYARIHLTKDQYTNPTEPPMFCMLLRKHLLGATIESVNQHEIERVLTITLKARNEIGDDAYKILMIELMGKHSNVMLVDRDHEHIIDSLKHVPMSQNRFRTIQPGHQYVLPPQQNKLNPLEADGETCIKQLDFNAGRMDQQIVHHISGFSPFIAKEVVTQAGLGGQKAYQEALDHLFNTIKDRDYKPAIYEQNKTDFHVITMTYTGEPRHVFSTVSQMLDAFYSGKAERDRVKQKAKDLYRFIKNEFNKNERKLKIHAQTLQKAEKADHYQKMGELLTAHMHLVQQGDQSITVTDYYDPDQTQIDIQLDPVKTPSENAQKFFKRYQKLKTSKIMVEKEIQKTNDELAYLDQLLQQIESAGENDIEEIREELREEGYLKKQKRGKQKNKPTKPKLDQYLASDGTLILVGKNNKQNDYATTKVAHRNDIWLHTKDIPGSHVIIKSSTPSTQTLEEAAILAAYYSKSRQSSSVPVDYTAIKHVKKPSGAKPGFVTYDQQKTLFVTPSEEVVKSMRQKYLRS
ncbi:Rqc2 family fibronectin-binding protein [Lentibacillus saliphilus]|uniref:Rqc2 family fibronectin-binding protein n=1 Tax=Lentibacillus saliphilus TaxID=2737028 RepID=UPI001C3013E7|nr:NFACT RNA binding domain-containing protein [Lentibacillus saliphilus]